MHIASVCPKAVRSKSSIQRSRSLPALSPGRGLLCLLALNGLFLLPMWWRDGGAGRGWLIPELLLLPLWAVTFGRRLAAWTMAAVLGLGLLALTGDALVRDVLGRPLNLLLDPWLLRAGYHFLSGSLGAWAAFAIALSAALLVGLLIVGLRAMLAEIGRDLAQPVAVMLALLAVVLAGVGLRTESLPLARPALIELAGSQAQQIATTLDDRARLIERADSPQLQARAIPALAERDVVVVFVESYGASAWEQPDYRAVIEPLMTQSRRALNAAGLEVMSTRLRSPIRGGQSWLAHASVLSGQHIDNDLAYNRVLQSNQRFLSDDFAATGHTPLVVAPAIVRPWPQARALGFGTSYPAGALGYQGPNAGWVTVPDQYTLRHYSQRIRPEHAGPVFTLLLLISSHAPWSPGPPLLEDWQQLDQAQPWPDWTPPPRDRLIYLRDRERLRSRYPQSLAYSLRAVMQWAKKELPADAVLLVLGDHQPATLITGVEASADVPVHLISHDARTLALDEVIEFKPGFDPGSNDSLFGLEDLRDWMRRRPIVEPTL